MPSAQVGPFRKPRILVLSASMGWGHVRAAQAVELALRRLAPRAVVRNLDVLRLTNPAFRTLYRGSCTCLVRYAPYLLDYLYDHFDRPDWFRRAFERLNLRPLVRLLEQERWDLVVNTHFLPGELVAALRQEGRIRTPQVMVVTDFHAHPGWCTRPCERFFLAAEETARCLQARGVPAEDTRVTGIPVHPAFGEAKDRSVCLARHGLSGHRPVVLQLAGGLGLGPMTAVHRALLEVERPLELVAVAGRNEEARQQLEALEHPPRHRVKVLGYTDAIDELLAAADLVVSKPGGLTTSEALARGVPMVIVYPIKGQEERNSDFLLENGAAVKVNELPTLAFKVGSLFDDPCHLQELRANARRLGRPGAAFDVAAECLDLLARAPAADGRARAALAAG